MVSIFTVQSTPSQGDQDSSGSGSGDAGNNDTSIEETNNENCVTRGKQCQRQRSQVPSECIPIRRYLMTRDRDDVQVQCCKQPSNQSNCTVSCNEGFTGDNVIYLCNTTDNNCIPVGGQEIMCERGLFIPDAR